MQFVDPYLSGTDEIRSPHLICGFPILEEQIQIFNKGDNNYHQRPDQSHQEQHHAEFGSKSYNVHTISNCME